MGERIGKITLFKEVDIEYYYAATSTLEFFLFFQLLESDGIKTIESIQLAENFDTYSISLI